MWSHFLQYWNGKSFFMEDYYTDAPDLSLYTDASEAREYGAYFQGHWFWGDWAPSQKLVINNDMSIVYQELFPIVLAAFVWDCAWSQKHILLHCDNEATVSAIDKGTSRSPLTAKLLRKLTLCSMLGGFVIRASHVPRKINHIADALSCNQVSKFFTLAPNACHLPTEVPRESLESLMPQQNLAITDNNQRVYNTGACTSFQFCLQYNLKPLGIHSTGTHENLLLYFAAHCARHKTSCFNYKPVLTWH